MEPKGPLACSKSSPPAPILSQTHPVHTTQSYLYQIHFNIIQSPSQCDQVHTSIICLVTTAWRIFGLRMEGSSEYIEYAAMDKQQAVVFQLEDNNHSQ
jgi:hypothetical protein